MIRSKWAAVVLGIIIGVPLFALIGIQSDHLLIGCICGIVMGSLIGYFTITNRIHRITVSTILGALVFAVVGPGTDVPGLFAAPVGAGVGLMVGCLGWPWIFGFLGALVGGVIGAFASSFLCGNWPAVGPSPGQCQLIGMVTGGSLAVVGGYHFRAKVAILLKSDTSTS